MQPDYFIGLDLGQAQDPSALCILERKEPRRGEYTYDCRHLQRWQLRTPYPQIVADTVKITNNERLRESGAYPTLAVDATGCGAPVVDLFRVERLGASLRAVQIVGGATISNDGDVTRIPKRDLVSVVQVALQNETLKIASELPDAQILVRELQTFQVKITDAGNDSYGAWREGAHDDLVLALALALWFAQNTSTGVFT